MLVDVIIILFLLMGMIVGFKRGVFKSAVMFIGTILVLIIAFYLKNPLSKLMYTYLPFFNLGGIFGGIKIFNIFLYEAIAFLIAYLILMSLLHVIIKITGLFELVLKFTIVLGVPSKLLGAIFGLFETYIFVFLILFVGSRLSFLAPMINESSISSFIMMKSPIISNITNDYYVAFEEIYSLKDKYLENNNEEEYNKEALDILLKYELITVDSADELVKKGKLDFNGANEVIDKYR